MAKKQNRKVSASINNTAKNSNVVVSTRNAATEFKPDYTDIFGDLKRIGILAASFITILVVLSFFLR